jgi:hypothetical protein
LRRVYVSGPYSAANATAERMRGVEIEANIERANQAALTLARRGYAPLVPHTMMRGWEDCHGVTRETAMTVALAWVEACDALLVLGVSPGATLEIERAQAVGLRVCHDIEDLPDLRALSGAEGVLEPEDVASA